ncbi:hypothetical protein F2Q68_00030271 [Brassica cretica]|uniref:Uncharacterized protein n=1 Tax=Brassica cretica TaxID=69181 RepID=A0A8S9GAZ6_BRACR|nr:hypothetical protein F2Q68_00030271 [Brassica cretica]
MRSRWGKPGLPSAAKPLSPTSGDAHLPLPFPPDLPDPSSSLSPIQFPPLSTTPSKTSFSAARRSHLSPPTAEVSATQNLSLVIVDITMVQSSPENCPTPTIFVSNQTEIVSQTTVPATGNPSQTLISNSTLPSTANPSDCYKLFSPSHNSPLLTNKSLNPKPSTNPPLLLKPYPQTLTTLQTPPSFPLLQTPLFQILLRQ